ncbi:MAG: lysozyme inhibitor LprI family protein [Paracoccaceae bacterium]
MHRTLAAIILATTATTAAHADRAEDAAFLMECAMGGDYPEACIGNIANPCLEAATTPAAEQACLERETAAWRAPAEGIFIAAMEQLAVVGDDLPDLMEKSQEGWEDYAYYACVISGMATGDTDRAPIEEARCLMERNAMRVIELMNMGR